MGYDAEGSWNALYARSSEMAWPAEGVIRIFKGTFPDLKMPKPTSGQKVLDVGCGDGRHLPLFQSIGLKSSAVEITDAIVEILRQRMENLGIPADIRTGHAGSLPYPDATFDYLLSWNSCYYMSLTGPHFSRHVDEMARVIAPGGWIVCSIPKRTSFIFKDSLPHSVAGYRVIADDYFGARNGEVMRCMESRDDLETTFSPRFDSFCHADLDMNWFGLAYHWHVFCARRR